MKKNPAAHAIRVLAVFVASLPLFNCGTNTGLQKITVSPANATVAKGENVQLAATGSYADGTQQTLTDPVTWQTSKSTVATVGEQGQVTGMGEGATQISASYQGVTGSTYVTIGPPALIGITVTPSPSSLPAGESEQLTASGKFSDGTVQNLTPSVTWSSSASNIATINTDGTASGLSVGSTTILAVAGNVQATASLTVGSAVLTSIAVAPANPSLVAGDTQQFTATGTYSDGSAQTLTSNVIWSSPAPAVAAMTPAGLVTGLTAGTSNIGATMGGITGSTMLTVTTPVLMSIAVAPGNPSLAAGTTLQFAATGTYNNGSTQDLTGTVAWSSSVPGVAAIGNVSGSQGLVSASALGLTTITASLAGVNGSTTLNVTAGFVLTGSLNTPRQYHTATLLNNGMVLVAGGFGSSGALASAELYNPATGTFTPTGSLNTARGQHTATLLQNGMVLIAGGTGSSGNISSAEIYNPSTATFTPTGNLNTARAMHAATMLGSGMVLISGGLDSNSLNLSSAELYNPASGSFALTGSLNLARSLHTATLLNTGLVLIAGGNPVGAQASAELYDPTSATFTLTGSLNTPRYDHTATLLNNGMVLIAGGTGSNGSTATAELYTAANGMFTPTGSLNTARFEHTATLLNNGTVLFAGGFAASGSLSSAELYDPASESPALTGSLNNGRCGHTATRLNNGMTLIAGGFSGVYLATAELYEPASLTPPNLVSISVAPGNPTIPLGAAQPMIATGTFSNNSTQQLASVTWSSSSTAAIGIGNDATDPGAAYAAASGSSATLIACAGSVCGSTSAVVGPAALLSIAVAPANATVAAGDSLQFSATGTYTDGSTQSLTSSSSLTWNSSVWAAATITSGGLATGVETGVSSITATVGSVTGSTNLTVTRPAVVGLTINPSTLFLSVGASLSLEAIATLSDGTTEVLTGHNAAWSVNGPAIAVVSSIGVVTAQANGSTTIVATVGSYTASASLTVAPVTALNITPASLSMAPGGSTQFRAIATMSDGRAEDVTAKVSWSSMQPSIAAVSGGLVTAAQLGTATIVAQGNGFSGSASLNVLAPVALNIVPAPVSLVIGGARQLRATATLSDGTKEDVTALATWSASATNIAAVSNTGLATGWHAGSTTVSAAYSGALGSTSVTVDPLLFVSYYSLVNAQAAGMDGSLYITNPGLTAGDPSAGNLCAMIYVFDQHQELEECCGCSVSDSGLRTLSLTNDLTANPLTGVPPAAGEIMMIPSDIGPNPQCDPGSLAPTGVLDAWQTNVQSVPASPTLTEATMDSVPLTQGNEAFLAGLCGYLETLGSGSGTCSCGTGDGGAARPSRKKK